MASLGIHKRLYKDLFPSLGLGGAEARSAYRHKLTLGLKGLGLGRTLYLWGSILESRAQCKTVGQISKTNVRQPNPTQRG